MVDWLDRTVYGQVTWMNLMVAILIFFGALIISHFLAVQLRRSLKEKLDREHLEILSKVVSYGIIIVALIWLMPMLGIDPSGLMVAGGIVALAIGFASQSIIGNLISGLFLIGERPVKIGDLVKISGEQGIVEDIRIISTSIRTLEGNFIRIPNETVFTSNITNYTGNPVRRFGYSVGISYADDANLAMNVIRNLIEEHPLALVNPEPQIFVENLGDSSVDITVRIWAPSSEWYQVKMELLWKIKKAIEDAGIEIPFPQHVVWFGKDEAKEVPGEPGTSQ